MTAKNDTDKTKDSNAVSVESTALLGLVADIRAAVGDPTGKLMQDELVAHCAEMLDRITRAEIILGRLATGYWHHTLNEHSEGENIGDRVLDYWRKYNEPNVPDQATASTKLNQHDR